MSWVDSTQEEIQQTEIRIQRLFETNQNELKHSKYEQNVYT